MASELASVLTRTASAHAVDIESWGHLVREDAEDSVHRMRVSARTLRSVVQVYAPLFDADARAEVNGILRRLGRRLSSARDAEVIRDLVNARLAELPCELAELVPQRAAKRLRKRPAKDYSAAHARLLELMESERYRDDLATVVAFARAVPLTEGLTREQLDDAAGTLAPFVTSRIDEIVSMAKGAMAATDAKERNHLLHELRKEAKRVRYASTAVEESGALDLGPAVADRVRAAKKLQRALGHHRDSVMLQQHLIRTARRARRKDEDTFAYGLLHARESAIQRKALKKTERHLDRLG